MLQALRTLQPCKNTGQNGGVSTKRKRRTRGFFPYRQVSTGRGMLTALSVSKSSARHIPSLNCAPLVNWKGKQTSVELQYHGASSSPIFTESPHGGSARQLPKER